MTRFTVILFSLFFNAILVNGQQGLTPTLGAESIAFGGSIATSSGIQSILNNQAGLSELKGVSVILNTEQRFLISDIIVASFGVGYKINKLGSLGLLISNLGYEEFREQKLALAYARKLTDKFRIGGQLDVLQTRISGFGSTRAITFELGTQVDISQEVMIGFHIYSPGNVTLSNGDEVPTRISLGTKYRISPKAFVVGEMQKIIDEDFSFRGGISYQLIDDFYLRAGASSNPVRLSFGLAYGFGGSLQFDASMSNHEVLGITPAASLTYEK